MAKPNYKYQKYLKEQMKKQKREEKMQRKLEKREQAHEENQTAAATPGSPLPSDTGTPSQNG